MAVALPAGATLALLAGVTASWKPTAAPRRRTGSQWQRSHSSSAYQNAPASLTQLEAKGAMQSPSYGMSLVSAGTDPGILAAET